MLDKTRFFHAKAIIAQTSKADHILFGSANCTSAALGSLAAAGINEEACLYRRLPAQASIAALGLEVFLTPEHEIERSEIAPQEPEDDLPLSELAKRNPGRFECIYDTLIWWPPDGVAGDTVIELLDADGNPAAATITSMPSEDPGTKRFRLTDAAEKTKRSPGCAIRTARSPRSRSSRSRTFFARERKRVAGKEDRRSGCATRRGNQ